MNTHLLINGASGVSLALASIFIPFASILGKVRRRVANVVRLEHIRFFSKHATDNSASMPDSLASVSFTLPDKAEILQHQDELTTRFKLPAALLLKRLASGNRVIMAKQDQRIIAMLWLAFDEQLVAEAGMKLTLRQNEFATFNALTLPEWRSRGLSTMLNQVAYEYCAKMGRTVQLTWRSTTNTSALRVAEKLHQESVGLMSCVWFFGHRIWCRYDQTSDMEILVSDHRLH
jgi:GNAT superfamily N-acetyltransferase